MPKLPLTSLEVRVGEQKLSDKHLFCSQHNILKEAFYFLFGESDFIQTFLLQSLPLCQKEIQSINKLILKIMRQEQIKARNFIVKQDCDKQCLLLAVKAPISGDLDVHCSPADPSICWVPQPTAPEHCMGLALCLPSCYISTYSQGRCP